MDIHGYSRMFTDEKSDMLNSQVGGHRKLDDIFHIDLLCQVYVEFTLNIYVNYNNSIRLTYIHI